MGDILGHVQPIGCGLDTPVILRCVEGPFHQTRALGIALPLLPSVTFSLTFPLPSSRHPCPAIPLSRVPSPPIHISSGSSSIPLTSLDISDYILKSEYPELRSTNKRKHVAFVLPALAYLLIQYDIFQCHSFTCQFRDFIFLYHWKESHCVCVCTVLCYVLMIETSSLFPCDIVNRVAVRVATTSAPVLPHPLQGRCALPAVLWLLCWEFTQPPFSPASLPGKLPSGEHALGTATIL